MTAYDLEIRHPHHHSDDEAEFFEEMSAQEIMEKFNAMNWKQLQILMLQMRGGKAEFTVTDNTQNLAVQISLIEMPETEALTFNFESDIEVSVEQSNLFGFLKYSKAVDVAFQGLNLAAAICWMPLRIRNWMSSASFIYSLTKRPPLNKL